MFNALLKSSAMPQKGLVETVVNSGKPQRLEWLLQPDVGNMVNSLLKFVKIEFVIVYEH